jgi:metal-responsive CopG/Arc/MetJ family transcriptional regulator
MPKYQGVSLSKELLDIIDTKIEGYGYQSRADFVRQAIRRELERLSRLKEFKCQQ